MKHGTNRIFKSARAGHSDTGTKAVVVRRFVGAGTGGIVGVVTATLSRRRLAEPSCPGICSLTSSKTEFSWPTKWPQERAGPYEPSTVPKWCM